MPISLALFLAAIFSVVCIIRFHTGLAVFVGLLPSYLVRTSLLGIPTTLLELFFAALVVAWLVLYWRDVPRMFHTLPWKWLMLLVLATATVGVLVAPDHTAALGYWKAYFVEPMVFAFLLHVSLTSLRQVRWMICAAVVSVVAIALVAFAQYIGRFPSALPWIAESPKRVTSIFEYPNAVGLYVAPIIALLGGLLLSGTVPKSAQRWGMLVIVIAGLGTLVMANSRGALLGVVAGLVAASLWTRRRTLVLSFVIVLAIVLLAVPATRSMVVRVATGSDVSTDVRTVLWQGTGNLLRAHPVLGAGLGGFPELYNKYRLIKHTELLLYPHNIILNFWVEIGLVGMLAVMALLVGVGMQLVRTLGTADSRVRLLALGLTAAWVAVVVHGIVDVPYFKNDLAMQWWWLVGLTGFLRHTSSRQTL